MKLPIAEKVARDKKIVFSPSFKFSSSSSKKKFFERIFFIAVEASSWLRGRGSGLEPVVGQRDPAKELLESKGWPGY